MIPELISTTHARADVSPADVESMFRVFSENFEGAAESIFRRDLAGKDWVVLLRDAQSAEIQGFSTLVLFQTEFEGQQLSVVYSGDTVIRRAYWGTPELPRAWVRTVLEKSAGMPQPLYWLLISSGYKTYRFLTVFYREFYPRFDQPTPPAVQRLMHTLALARFGADYDPACGVVRFTEGATPLRAGVAEVTDGRLHDPHVQFYVERNPGHVRGDELVCLARVHPDNFTPAGRRLAR